MQKKTSGRGWNCACGGDEAPTEPPTTEPPTTEPPTTEPPTTEPPTTEPPTKSALRI